MFPGRLLIFDPKCMQILAIKPDIPHRASLLCAEAPPSLIPSTTDLRLPPTPTPQQAFFPVWAKVQPSRMLQYRMMQGSLQQFCAIQLSGLFQHAYEVSIRVVGAVKEIFQHKRYIVQVYLGKKLVLRCLKRYSEFEALYEVIRMNFKNIDLNLNEFPSKFQVINREETRREYFELLLNRAIQVYAEKVTNETNRRLLSTIYVFMAGEQAKPAKTTMLSEGSSYNEENPRKASLTSEDGQEGKENREVLGKMKGSVHRVAEVLPSSAPAKSMEKPSIQTEELHLRAFMSTQFLIRFSDEQEWKERFLKLQGSRLMIYKHKNDNNFKTKIELYQANIHYLHRDKNILDHFCEKMEFDNEATYLQDFTTLAIHHQYDYRKLLVKVKEDHRLPVSLLKELLVKASHQTTNCQQIEGVFSPIGKLFLILHRLYLDSSGKKLSPIVYVRINAGGLVYQSKLMNVTSSAAINIKQGFLIPISNAFANIFIQVVVNENDGIISHGTEEKCVGRYRLCFSDLMSYPSGYGLEKIHGKPEVAYGQAQKYESLLELSVINYSHFSSNYADSYANENDGVIMQGLKSTQDTELLVITVDRVLRVIGNIALFITAFWRNVYLFKYPRMGYAFFTLLPILILLGNAGVVFQLLLGSLLFAMAYNLPRIHYLLKLLLDAYVFSQKHPCHKQPLCIDSNQLKFMKWTQNLTKLKDDYRLTMQGKLEKTEQAKAKKVEYWQFQVHGKHFRIREELPSLLEKVFEVKKIIELVLRMINAVINTVEKVCNVLSWADPRRSLVIFLLLVLIACVASSYLFRGIGIVFCLHRLWKGESFYRIKHYNNNRKLAIYALRYIVNKAFPHLLPNKAKRIQTAEQAETVTILGEVLFPVRDQAAVKKLKQEVEFILGVFIDAEQLLRREEKKNEMRMFYLIEIIESCEARLKLEWISGAQGISEDFQELKALTKEDVVIDLWVESLLINFFWNTPSQLYTTFRPVRSPTSLRCEKAKEKIGDCFVKLAA